jgi:hypothetical protein
MSNVYEQPENSNVLWHLLNAYMPRELNARLQEEIIEAVKLVCVTVKKPFILKY